MKAIFKFYKKLRVTIIFLCTNNLNLTFAIELRISYHNHGSTIKSASRIPPHRTQLFNPYYLIGSQELSLDRIHGAYLFSCVTNDEILFVFDGFFGVILA